MAARTPLCRLCVPLCHLLRDRLAAMAARPSAAILSLSLSLLSARICTWPAPQCHRGSDLEHPRLSQPRWRPRFPQQPPPTMLTFSSLPREGREGGPRSAPARMHRQRRTRSYRRPWCVGRTWHSSPTPPSPCSATTSSPSVPTSPLPPPHPPSPPPRATSMDDIDDEDVDEGEG